MSNLIEPSASDDLDDGRALAIPIHVNTHEVVVTKRRMTGLEIKTAAKAAGVQIELEFTLILKHLARPSESIGDDQVVVMNRTQRFSCMPADDNS